MKRASKILALIVLALNVLAFVIFFKYDWDYRQEDIFHVSVLRIYVKAILLHFFIAFCLIPFLFGKIIKRELLSQTLCFLSLIPTLSFYWRLFMHKEQYLSDTTSYTLLLRSSVALDWLGAAIILFLLGYQVTIAFRYFSNKFYTLK